MSPRFGRELISLHAEQAYAPTIPSAYRLQRAGSTFTNAAVEPTCIKGWVEACLERIGEDNPDEEQILRDLWDDETQREVVVESLKAYYASSGREDLRVLKG